MTSTAADVRALEAENITVVKAFFADGFRRDTELLATYLADDFVYQMIEGEPDLSGPAKFVKTLGAVLKTFTRVDMHRRNR